LRCPAVLDELGLGIVWFDSMGAKSACVTACWGKVVIDPGAAEMQPSYPLSASEKRRLRKLAVEAITRACSRAEIVVVTHYHYDHHILPSDEDLRPMDPRTLFLNGKKLFLKNPNSYINESQWHRARRFLSELLSLASDSLSSYLMEPASTDFEDPVEALSIALSRDFGSYQRRREELLRKGRQWFEKLKRLWSTGPWIRSGIELSDGTRISWGEGSVIELGSCRIEILGPWFHGIEYDRTGWVTPVVIETPRGAVFYTSDLMGPAIEDYAYEIARRKPRVVVADGPPTYLFPYMLNRVNLERAIDNAIHILESGGPEVMIYDHHLLRERRWRKRVERLFDAARKLGVELVTAAECLGSPPLIDTL